MDNEKLLEMQRILSDPTVSDAVKDTIRQGLQQLAQGGFRQAYETNLAYLARTDLAAYSEYVYGYTPAPHHKEIIKILSDETRIRELIVAGPNSAKCESKNTKIIAANGALLRAGDVKRGTKILSLNPQTLKTEPKKVLWVEDTGVKECFRVTTRSGYYVDITADHRMYTFDGWKECRDLTVGDYMAAPRSVPEPTVPVSLDENVIKLLAYWIAEGCRSKGKGAVEVATSSEEMAVELEEIAVELGFKTSHKRAAGALKSVRVLRGGAPAHPRVHLLAHGLDPSTCGAHDKFIPVSIFRLPKHQVALFLNRLFACDGTFTTPVKRNGERYGHISYCSVSRELIDGVRHLLLRFGIAGKVRKCLNTDGTGSGKVFESWKLDIAEGDKVHTFMDEIGMFTKDSRFTSELRKTTPATSKRGNADKIPAGWRSHIVGVKVPRTPENSVSQVRKKGGTSRAGVLEIAELTDTPELYSLAESDIRWDDIVSIESVGLQETCDLEVEDNHNFFANSLLSHNSTYVSNIYPSFWMGHNPEKSAIIVSRSATQAEAFLGGISDTISSNDRYHNVFPDTKPNKDRGWTKSSLFLKNRKNTARPDPNLLASGMVGPIVGRRAELIILDDPADEFDAASETISGAQKSWIIKTLLTRLKSPQRDRFIAIMTRWHSNDISSMLFNDLGFRLTLMPTISTDARGAYVEFYLPGEQYAEEYDEALEEVLEDSLSEGNEAEIIKSPTMNRYCVRKFLHENKSPEIWPDEHPLKDLLVMKKAMGSVQFDLVYNGNATGLSGDVFKREWFRLYGPGEEKEYVPDNAYYFQSVDVAVSAKDGSDYFVILTLAVDTQGNYYVVDVFRERLEAPLQPKTIVAKYREYPKTEWVLIETNAYQLALFQNVSAEGIPVKKFTSMKDKVARGRSAAAKFEANLHSGSKVYLNKLGPWLTDFRDELTTFPRGEHDDQVDAISSLFEELALNPIAPVTYRVTFG